MTVQEKCDGKKQVAVGLLCGQLHTHPFAREGWGTGQCYYASEIKSLGQSATLKSHPSKNEGWGTRQ